MDEENSGGHDQETGWEEECDVNNSVILSWILVLAWYFICSRSECLLFAHVVESLLWRESQIVCDPVSHLLLEIVTSPIIQTSFQEKYLPCRCASLQSPVLSVFVDLSIFPSPSKVLLAYSLFGKTPMGSEFRFSHSCPSLLHIVFRCVISTGSWSLFFLYGNHLQATLDGTFQDFVFYRRWKFQIRHICNLCEGDSTGRSYRECHEYKMGDVKETDTSIENLSHIFCGVTLHRIPLE
jgi:hypothetical protein